MRGPSEAITDILVENSVIAEDQRPLYTYGLHQLGITILNVATTVLIGLFAGMVWQCLLFLLAYIPLRRCAGGYHAKTELRCYIASTLLVIFSLFGIYTIPPRLSVLLPLFLISGATVYFLAPIDSMNKPLDKIERMVYRRRSRYILAVHFGIVIVAGGLSVLEVISIIVIANTTLGIMLILGWAKRTLENHMDRSVE